MRAPGFVLLLLVALVAIGTRCLFVLGLGAHVDYDGERYIEMADSLLQHRAFLDPATLAPTHHYPPLFPLLLVLPLALGLGKVGALGVFVLVGAAASTAAFATTRSLFGDGAGLASGLVVAASPLLVLFDALGYADDLLLLTYTLTIYCVYRSLRAPRWVLGAGVFAGLSFLTKASIGPFFFVAAACGVAWRLRHRGPRALVDRWYVAAAVVFALLAGAWTLRNVLAFGIAGWETQPYATDAILQMLRPADAAHLGNVALVVVAKLLAMSAWLALASIVPLAHAARYARRAAVDREVFGFLLLATILPLVLGALYATAFHYAEGRPLVDVADARYIMPSIIPLMWFGFAGAPYRRLSRRERAWERMHAHHWRKLEAYLLTDQDLATSTTRKLLRFCRLLERGGIDLLRPRRDRYRRFMADRKAAGRDGPGSRHYARAMRHALAWRGKFWPGFRLPRFRCNRRAVLPDAVIQATLDYAPDDVGELQARVARSCFRLIFYFLVRPPSEVFALKVTDIDETHRRLNVTMDKLDVEEEEDLQEWEVDVLREALATRAAVLEATRARVAWRRRRREPRAGPWHRPRLRERRSPRHVPPAAHQARVGARAAVRFAARWRDVHHPHDGRP